MSGFKSLRDELKDKEFRDSYVTQNTRRSLAYQIRALRDARGWSQSEFGRQAGKPQSNIHRWEDPTYGKFSLSSLIEIAAIFDVALIVRFAGFEELLTSVGDLRPRTLAVPTFEEERAAIDAQAGQSPGGAVAAFLAPLEQRVHQRSALNDGPEGMLRLPPLHLQASNNQSNALTAAAQ